LFKGKPFVSQEAGEGWARGDEAYRLTKIPKEKRTEIWKKLTKGTDIHFQTSEAKDRYREIKESRTRAKEKYGITSEEERRAALKMLEKSLGKSLGK